MSLESIFFYINIGLEVISVLFISYVFFELLFTDKKVQLSGISEKFEKFKRYEVFKSSLIFLVLSLYFVFFSKLTVYLKLPVLAFYIFNLISNVFLLLFTFRLFKLLTKYVSKD